MVASGLAALMVADFVLLRPFFAPLERLVEHMRSVDLLRPGRRLRPNGIRAFAELVAAFNDMLDRLETERHASGRRALDAQESERLQIAQDLHEEVGQNLTGVLLSLRAVTEAIPEDRRAELPGDAGDRSSHVRGGAAHRA